MPKLGVEPVEAPRAPLREAPRGKRKEEARFERVFGSREQVVKREPLRRLWEQGQGLRNFNSGETPLKELSRNESIETRFRI